MKKIKSLLALLSAGVITTGCANVRTIGEVNGVTITSVRQRGVFSPSKTTLLGSTPIRPNEVEVLADASGPGFIPAVATAGGIAGGAALLRPARTSVNASNVSDNDGVSTGNISVHPAVIPPPPPASGHPNSPGNGGIPGNGGANNPNN
jgi:hypothetical protein